MTDLRKLTMFTVAALMLSPASGLAQVAGNSAATGPAAPSGDAAVSPASGNAQAGGARVSDRPGAGAGVNSGVLDNGTTGDTIGTGHGTSGGTDATPRH
jgi:hypothetical protein